MDEKIVMRPGTTYVCEIPDGYTRILPVGDVIYAVSPDHPPIVYEDGGWRPVQFMDPTPQTQT